MEDEEKHSGIYAFKTVDSDSKPFPHKIESILTQSVSDENHRTQQFVIRYENELKEISVVKVKLRESFEALGDGSGCEPIEFDVDFAGLPLGDMDATINWKSSDLEN